MNEIKGLVISSIDYKEKSKVVYLYTPNGHDSVKAYQSKDFKKGLLGFTTTLNEVSYVKTNSKFSTLMEYSVLNNNFKLTESVDILNCVFKILEVIKAIPEESDHKRIYDYIITTINNLNNHNPKKVLALFLIKMLHTFGVTPNLKHCIKCGSTNIQFLSISHGECYCGSCTSYNNIDKYKIWYEYYYDKKNTEMYSEVDYDNLLNDIYSYYSNHVHINIK
ncbi:MAG: DNA repair protein RecO [Erysipelotrichaceae bacterium]|nr:DNA repair protein RecO [Erysipelotrichaceae bacterium]